MSCSIRGLGRAAAAWALLLIPVASSAIEPAVARSYFDEFIEPAIEEQLIPGAILAVVKREGPVALKAYGVADIETGREVDAEKTLFRIGSITKVFTAIMALQMLDEGIIQRDTDIRSFFDGIDIDTVDNRPITIRHLLSHQGGFDKYVGNMSAPVASATKMSAAQMEKELVAARRPGELASYDNMGVALLAVVLAHLDGQSYAEMVNKRIFAPVGMQRTVVGLPGRYVREASRCHEYVSGAGWRICEHELLRDLAKGAGDISTTAGDMSKFLRMLLNGGEINNRRVLSRERFAELIDMNLNRIHPEMNGMGRIVFELGSIGYGLYGHGGGIRGFRSLIVVSPVDGIGVFMSINGIPRSPAGFWEQLFYSPDKSIEKVQRNVNRVFSSATELFRELGNMNEIAGATADGPQTRKFDQPDIGRLSGDYSSVRNLDVTTFSRKVLAYFQDPVKVTPSRNVAGVLVDGDGPYLQKDPHLFVREEPIAKVAFVDINDRYYMYRSIVGPLQKLRWFEDPYVLLWPLLVGPIALLLVGFRILRGGGEARFAGAALCTVALLALLCLWLELTFGAKIAASSSIEAISYIWRFFFLVLFAALFIIASGSVLAFVGHQKRATNSRFSLLVSAVERWHIAVAFIASSYLLILAVAWTFILQGSL